MKIAAHTVVKNEDRWVWYSLMSVLDRVDEIQVVDTGSTDRTVEVIRSISSPKIRLRCLNLTSPADLTRTRQEMLDRARPDWLLLLDGDEIWPRAALEASLAAVHSGENYDYLVSRYYNLAGDVFHRQEEAAGQYHIGLYRGHITIRFVNLKKHPGLKYQNQFPAEALILPDGTPLQQLSPERNPLIDPVYLHATFLNRSGSPDSPRQVHSRRFKYELGLPLGPDFEYPPCFYLPHPGFVPSPWTPRSPSYFLQAAWQSPLKWLMRRVKS